MDARDTAAAIARVRRQEGERPVAQRLFDDPYARLFDDPLRDVREIFALIPFFEEHIRLRTRYLDDAARAAVRRGVTHVVLLGAGFDTRALRMPELGPPVQVIEVDHSEQIANKKARLASADVTLPRGLTHVPVDLAQTGALALGLAGAGLSAPARTLWICEGLFGYLSLPVIEGLARTVAAVSAPGSLLIATHAVHVWSTAALASAFEPAGFSVTVGPSFDSLHRQLIGPSVPPGGDSFTFTVATRR
jgi:methyltransferase (TIGR00027 family)